MVSPNGLADHEVLPYEQWFERHKAHLAKEKAFTQQRAQLAAERRALPWLQITKNYLFETERGMETLGDLFKGRSQLIIYHFMLGPGSDHRCTGCSFLSDHIDATDMHVRHHDISFVVSCRAPLAEILPYKGRMGWRFDWVSAGQSDFNYDFQLSFTQEQLAAGHAIYNFRDSPISGTDYAGVSVFYKDQQGRIFHTFSTRGRGGENVIGTYAYLDMMPKGRNETGPHGSLADWVKLHDEYDETGGSSCGCAPGPAW
jgi:predicted dithiol-disulfide oxidoreductase (DUF899 family)